MISTDTRTDEELLRCHVAGDCTAFPELMRRHRDRLWHVALGVMRHPQDAEDALQDALISAFRRANTFRGSAAVTTWLHRIVVNACLDRIRRLKVRAAESLPENFDRSPDFTASDDDQPESQVVRSEQARKVHEALARLNHDQRIALILVDMQGFHVDEVAVMLGCAPGTVKSRCSRGRAKLAVSLHQFRQEGGA